MLLVQKRNHKYLIQSHNHVFFRDFSGLLFPQHPVILEQEQNWSVSLGKHWCSGTMQSPLMLPCQHWLDGPQSAKQTEGDWDLESHM